MTSPVQPACNKYSAISTSTHQVLPRIVGNRCNDHFQENLHTANQHGIIYTNTSEEGTCIQQYKYMDDGKEAIKQRKCMVYVQH